MADDYRHHVTSFPTMPALCPITPEFYRRGEDGQRQIILLVAVPAPPQSSCPDERTTTPVERSAGVSVAHAADDLTTRPTCCADPELQTNEGLSRESTLGDTPIESAAVATPRLSNPVFGKSKSPKSYWLRRHSDSVFAGGADRDLVAAQSDDERAASRNGKERTVSDSQSAVRQFDLGGVSSLFDDRQPLMCPFQSPVLGMQLSGESDDVFDESPTVQSTHLNGLQHAEEPTTAYQRLEQSSVHSCRGRLTVVSAGNLEDIDEERQSPGVSEPDDESRCSDGCVADTSKFAKLEESLVNDQPLSDGVRSMELSGGNNPLWQYHPDEPTGDDDQYRKLSDGERELDRPEAAASSRSAAYRRASRVARCSRPSEPTSSRSDAATSGGGGNGKIHRCTVCRRTFSRSDMLERHARLHTGVRPYACRLCTQVFSRSDHLTTHLRTHTGEKPYACPRCAYTASRRDMVTRHLRVHQSTPSVDPAAPVSGVVGPPRRRIYRSRYKERSTRPGGGGVPRRDVDDTGHAAPRTSPPVPQSALLDEGTSYVRSGVDDQRLNGGGGVTLAWPPGALRRDTPTISLPSPSPPASETATRRRLEHFQALHALSRSVVARGSTGSTDSYSSPGSLSACDVFEFGVSGIDGSPDVFRSPSSARQSTMFLFPYTAASNALSVCDQTDSF